MLLSRTRVLLYQAVLSYRPGKQTVTQWLLIGCRGSVLRFHPCRGTCPLGHALYVQKTAPKKLARIYLSGVVRLYYYSRLIRRLLTKKDTDPEAVSFFLLLYTPSCSPGSPVHQKIPEKIHAG